MKQYSPFHFKQFTIEQAKCAMKVGTDGVLLGGWIPGNMAFKNILDIGTGTGLIALMLAQKFPQSKITGIDPLKDTASLAAQNFSSSKWSENLTAKEATLRAFYEECTEKFDLIASNPPFHDEKILSPDNLKRIARATVSLPFEELLYLGSKLLSEEGYFALIVPFKNEDHIITLAMKNLLTPVVITRIRGNINSVIKRSLLLFGKTTPSDTVINEIFLEESRHNFSSDYKALTKDYYLHL